MALAKQAIELPLGVGIDESVRKELLDAGRSVAAAHNLVVDKAGAYTQRDRLTTYPFQLNRGQTVHEYDQRYPVVVDNDQLHDWSDVTSSWVNKGPVSEVVATRSGGVQPPPNAYIYQFDSVVLNDVRVTILCTPRGENGGLADDDRETNYTDVYYQVTDVRTDTVLQPITLLAQMFGPAIAGGLAIASTPDGYVTVFGVVTDRDGGGLVTQARLQAWRFTISTPSAAPSVHVLETNPTGNGFFGASVTRRGNSLVYFNRSVAAAEFRIRTFVPATAATTAVTSPVQNISTFFWVCRCVVIVWDDSANVLWLVYRDKSTPANALVRVLDATYTTIIANDTLSVGSIGPDTGDASTICATLGQQTTGVSRDLWVSVSRLIDGHHQAATVMRKVVRNSASTLVVNDFGNPHYGVMAYSDIVNRAGRWFQWFQPVPITKQVRGWRQARSALPYLAFCEVTTATTMRPVANVAPGLVDEIHHGLWPHIVQQVDADTYEMPASVRRNTVTSNLETVRLSFADRRRQMSAPFGDLLALSGGSAQFYDGSRLAEIGFIAPPNIMSQTLTWDVDKPGGKVLPGTYSCFAIWRAVDARGNVHVSNMSNVLTLEIAADSTVRIDAHPLILTGRDGGVSTQFASVRCVLYATRANGSTFYEMDDIPAAWLGGANKAMYFDDADRNRLFYTQPGVPGASLFRYAPPSLRCLIQHNGALAGVAEDGRTIWFSGLHLAGEGPWFHPAFTGYVDDMATIEALASMDGRLFAFTAGSIWTIDGNGFSDNGEGGYGPPTRIAADAGCTNERSVVVTPIGILFQSELGIALLSRAGQVSWFGRVVEDTLREYGTITSAVLVRPKGEVRFTLADAAGTKSGWLSWNYRDNVWTTGAREDADTGPIVHSALVQRGDVAQWHVLYAGGVLVRENGQGLDYLGQHVETRLSTAWIKVAGVQGFQRVLRVLLLFSRKGPAGIRMSLAYDYDETPVETRVWTAAEVQALTSGAVEIHCGRQKCTAIRVTVESVAPPEETTGLSHDLIGLRLICGVKAKTPRGAAAR